MGAGDCASVGDNSGTVREGALVRTTQGTPRPIIRAHPRAGTGTGYSGPQTLDREPGATRGNPIESPRLAIWVQSEISSSVWWLCRPV